MSTRWCGSPPAPQAIAPHWSARDSTSGRSSSWCAITAANAAQLAHHLELPLGVVQAAIGYYGAYQAEVEWIELNERESADAHAHWLAAQDAVRR
jgi:hypothetical protein